MKLPILVYEPCSLDIFDSVEAAELYHEKWILDDQNNTFYDADGRRLEVAIGTERPISITCDPNAPTHPEELADALIEFLLAVGKSLQEIDVLALSSLIEEAYPFARNKN